MKENPSKWNRINHWSSKGESQKNSSENGQKEAPKKDIAKGRLRKIVFFEDFFDDPDSKKNHEPGFCNDERSRDEEKSEEKSKAANEYENFSFSNTSPEGNLAEKDRGENNKNSQ
ncbi:MAG: hypothetical protein M1287_00575 [Firmicutes bacterium]|jgi:hypothetical protein|nr:hypothetical protein [Bacillota bacterium]